MVGGDTLKIQIYTILYIYIYTKIWFYTQDKMINEIYEFHKYLFLLNNIIYNLT